jgi:Mor family transcriptional regulator
MDFEDQVDFLIEHLDQIPDDSLDRAISILVQAGEIDLAASLARIEA